MTTGSRLRFLLGITLTVVAAGCQAPGGQTGEARYEPRSNQGDVAFQLTPRGVVDGRFVVDLSADTHSGDLSEIDLARATTLEIGEERYRPVEASALAGHHAQGTLVFSVADVPDDFSIVVAGVREMGDLRFEWAP